MFSEELSRVLIQQNEVIISLLARIAFPIEKVIDIVVRGKKDAEAYKRAYNSLDGKKNGTEIAKIASVTQQTMSSVLQTWEQQGIVVNVGTQTQPRFRNLLSIPQSQARPDRPMPVEENTPESPQNG